MGRRSERGRRVIHRLAAAWGASRQMARSLGARAAIAGAVMLVMAAGSAPAQDLGSGTGLGDLLQQYQQMQQGGNAGAPNPMQPQSEIIQAPTPFVAPEPPSRLELVFSDRANLPMRQFGYSLFEGVNQITIPTVGAIQGYYVLGPGDELQISLRGQENASYDVLVDNDGNVILPKLPPIHAAGQSFSDFQTALVAAIRKAYISTSVYVSVGQMRRVSVTVAGEVNAPGVKMLTGLSTPLDALVLALGVKKSGSLRNIMIYRGGETLHYDLYHVLLNDGEQPIIRLADGDRIVVPPVGHVIGVSGWVHRPGIYELAPGQRSASLTRLLALAGGVQVRGKFRYSLMTTDRDGRSALVSLSSSASGTAQDGDILFVERAVDERVGQFEFFGPTSLAGEYSLDLYPTLATLLRAPGAMGQSPDMLFGVISRKNPATLQRSLLTFSPQEILAGRSNLALQSEDIVRIFDLAEAGMLADAVGAFTKRVDYLQAASAAGVTFDGAGPIGSANDAASAVSAAQDAAVRAAISANLRSPSASILPSNTAIGGQPGSALLSSAADATGMSGLQGGQVTGSALPGGSAQASATMPQYQTQQQMQQQQSPWQSQQQTPWSAQQGGLPGPWQQQMLQNSQVLQSSTGPFMLDERISSQGNVPITGEAPNIAGLGLQVGVDPTVLISVMADHRVSMLGAVRSPGTFIVGGANTLQELAAAAGGTQNWADLSRVELTRTAVDQRTGRAKTSRVSVDLSTQSTASIEVMPRDVFRFNQIDTDVGVGTIVAQGEVRYPGTYDLVRGERLSDLLKQAGGLTRQAYPYGAVFLRKSVADSQSYGFQRSADDIEKQITVAVAQGASSDSQKGFSTDVGKFLEGLVLRLRNTKAPGRLTIIADPAMLAANPSADIALQPGDFIYVPSRPSSVSVVGEVLNPASYTVRPSLSIDDYIQLAGGYARFADDDHTFVVYPDGTTRKAESGLFDFGSPVVPPGSVIVVPRDLTPFNYNMFISDVTKVLSNLAVTAASLSVIGRNQ